MFKYIRKLGLTKKELGVIIFLFITFTIGLILKLSGFKKPNSFNYTSSDKRFEEQIKKSFEELEKERKSSEEITQRRKLLRNYADSLIAEKDKKDLSGEKLTPGTRININTAMSLDLEMLPGVGKLTAERIIEYRENMGKFKKPEDIMKVKGIGEKKFEKMREFISVE